MSVWSRLFGRGQDAGTKDSQDKEHLGGNKKIQTIRLDAGTKESQDKEYREKDNMGTRHDTLDQASIWWMANLGRPKGPFLVYTFASGEDARAALLDVRCMREVKTTGKIICTELLIYGFYQRTDGVWEAEIVGKDFSYELWTAAKEAFCRHGGKLRSEEEPEKTEETTMPKTAHALGKVTFVREDHGKSPYGGKMMTYRIHSAPSVEVAKQFLQDNPVDKPLFYIVVETPEGNYCRDKTGIYKE